MGDYGRDRVVGRAGLELLALRERGQSNGKSQRPHSRSSRRDTRGVRPRSVGWRSCPSTISALPRACTSSAIGKRYDSKAVVGAAIGRLPGRTPLRAPDSTGGLASVVRVLERLGYIVMDERPGRNQGWAPEEIILALDLYLTHNQLGKKDVEVVELSVTLNHAHHEPERPDAEKWRIPMGSALNLAEFRHLIPATRAAECPALANSTGSSSSGSVRTRTSSAASRPHSCRRRRRPKTTCRSRLSQSPTAMTPTLHPARESPRCPFPSSNTTR